RLVPGPGPASHRLPPPHVMAAGLYSVTARLDRLDQAGKGRAMSKNLYVGNLPFSTTEADLTQAFGAYGTVTRAQIVTDRDTGRSRGFGFVEMSDGADQAIAALNGAMFQGRTLTVNEARPREERPRNGGGGGGGRGGYGGGGGGRRDRY